MTRAIFAAAGLLSFSLVLGAAPAAGRIAPQGVLGGPIRGTPSRPPLSPVDEAVSQPDFFAFRAHLQAALARRDLDSLLRVTSPDIKVSFGGDHGIEGLMMMWSPRERDSRLWEELARVLSLGGTFDGGMFIAPYVYSQWPRDVDAFEHVALVAADVPLRAEPREDAPELARSSFGILPLARTGAREVDGWTAVRAPDGRTAYVAASMARSPIDYRAFFERRDGQWTMIMFLAGD